MTDPAGSGAVAQAVERKRKALMQTEQLSNEVEVEAAPEASIEEAAPIEAPEVPGKQRDPVPYDRFRAVNKEKKFLRKQVLELQARLGQAPAPQSQAPTQREPEFQPVSKDPKVAEAERMFAQAARSGVKPEIDRMAAELAEVKQERAQERDLAERGAFWEEHAEDTDLKDNVEARYRNMVSMAYQAGQKPLFTREDIYNYELGLKTRAGRAKSAETKKTVADVNRAAMGVVGARPGAQKPPPKPVGQKTKAELDADEDFRNFQF